MAAKSENAKFGCLVRAWLSEQNLCISERLRKSCGREAAAFYAKMQRNIFHRKFPLICEQEEKEEQRGQSGDREGIVKKEGDEGWKKGNWVEKDDQKNKRLGMEENELRKNKGVKEDDRKSKKRLGTEEDDRKRPKAEEMKPQKLIELTNKTSKRNSTSSVSSFPSTIFISSKVCIVIRE